MNQAQSLTLPPAGSSAAALFLQLSLGLVGPERFPSVRLGEFKYILQNEAWLGRLSVRQGSRLAVLPHGHMKTRLLPASLSILEKSYLSWCHFLHPSFDGGVWTFYIHSTLPMMQS